MTGLRSRLDAGKVQLGLCAMYPSPGIIERIGRDWDFVWIDSQHGQQDYRDILETIRACEIAGTGSLVRVPWLEAGAIGKALDAGCDGVIVPCIDTIEEAKLAVDAAKFPPYGRRSYGARRQIDLHGRTYADTANHDQLLVVQIESPAAVDIAEEIAALPGVDALMIGPDDLLLRRGISMSQPRSPDLLRSDMERIATAARNQGKLAVGLGFDTAMINLNLELGYQLIISGGDVGFLATSSAAASAQARTVVEGVTVTAAKPGNGPY
ncbi:aldolase/citrate lyase family protein [Devosia sp. YIM 151766]|uniref:HpcH/HpaI aldolase family protein n=1 Tax=Devosia sp. YIM 151766 TaxID=3017325 RepID=UPI00255C3E9F|nr:aldolase/citrate lyase family protein [Devosia sp. YIM 151766]WIY52089.1 aldolase/citrate lyase family protein [Devosia sp. YIM 151766]